LSRPTRFEEIATSPRDLRAGTEWRSEDARRNTERQMRHPTAYDRRLQRIARHRYSLAKDVQCRDTDNDTMTARPTPTGS
jgi:hypothetical protein